MPAGAVSALPHRRLNQTAQPAVLRLLSAVDMEQSEQSFQQRIGRLVVASQEPAEQPRLVQSADGRLWSKRQGRPRYHLTVNA